MTDPFVGLATLGQLSLPVHDLAAAEEFYRDQLGLRHLFSVPNLVFFDCDGVRLMLSTPEDAQRVPSSTTLYFKVADIALAYTTLQERGVTFLDTPHMIAAMPDHDLWMVFLSDPSGNLLGLMEERARAEA